MKKIFIAILVMALSTIAFSQPSSKPEILYGAITQADLAKPPYNKWFDSTYKSYQPAAATVAAIRAGGIKDIEVEIFLGTWCGDSRREVPRFMKLLTDISIPGKKIKMIALGAGDSLYKQSPQHEETGKGIFRVPVFIVYKNGKELGRINEFPVISLEKDLHSILSGAGYVPNYKSFSLIDAWLNDDVLTDKNSNIRGLALQLKPLLNSERELNSLGYLLLEHGKKQEAFRIFQVNAQLYPESANVLSSLGEGYFRTGDARSAVQFLEKALEINKDPLLVKEILKILYEVKGVKG